MLLREFEFSLHLTACCLPDTLHVMLLLRGLQDSLHVMLLRELILTGYYPTPDVL